MKVILAVITRTLLRGSLSFMSLFAVQIYDFHIFLTINIFKQILLSDIKNNINKINCSEFFFAHNWM